MRFAIGPAMPNRMKTGQAGRQILFWTTKAMHFVKKTPFVLSRPLPFQQSKKILSVMPITNQITHQTKPEFPPLPVS
jgi:hypothetical protein